ncbi:MAG: hypothetical protein HYS07_05685, partial [Chlamydiae bacterium]|nr:hypothetical protein [Chlamydiota bacterium]
MFKTAQKCVSFILILSFLFYDIATPYALERSGINPISLANLSNLGVDNLQPSLLEHLTIPSDLGEIKDRKIIENRPLLFIIEDIHCNSEVQKNIAGILQILKTQLEARGSKLEAKTQNQLEARGSKLEAKAKAKTKAKTKAEVKAKTGEVFTSSLEPRASSRVLSSSLEPRASSIFSVFSEGSVGQMDMSFFSSFPDQEALQKTQKKFLKNHDLN